MVDRGDEVAVWTRFLRNGRILRCAVILQNPLKSLYGIVYSIS